MSKIKLKTDGDRYNQLIEKKEKQLADLVALDEHEKQASKECSQAFQRYMDAARENTAYAKQRLAELQADRNRAEENYRQAALSSFALIEETANTFVAIVVELIHDNIDVLDGMSINGKQAFLALNEALPDDIFVDTNMSERDTVLYVRGGNTNQRVRIMLNRGNIGTQLKFCGRQNHFIDKKRFLDNYGNDAR